MQITRLFTTESGESEFEEMDIPVTDAGDIGLLSKNYNATGIIFRETSADYAYSWHNAPCRQFVIMLDGEVEIEVSSGKRRIFRTGDILLAEDTTGRGHISRAVNAKPRKSIFVTLD